MRAAALTLLGVALALGLGCRAPTSAEPAAGARVHVDDPSGLLGPFGVIVEGQGRGLIDDLGIDARVVTLEKADENVAPLAERLFRERGVGSEAATGGILVVLVRGTGQARIEVSYSLEGVLPDIFVAELARDQLVPYASHRAAGMAVMDVLHFLRNRLLDSVASGDLRLAEELRQPDHLERLLVGHSGGAGAQVALPKLPSHTEYKRRVPDARRALYAPSDDPLETAAALQRSRRDLAGDPTLELFTEGSRVMRARYPVAPYEELLRAEAYERSAPLELQVHGDRAFLGSKHPARDFVPVMMVRGEDELWRVDLVETFKSFFFDDEGAFRLVNLASPYAEFAEPMIRRSDATLAPLDLRGEPLEAVIGRLEQEDSARGRFMLAELLMRNCFVSAEALPLYAEAAEAAPRDRTIVTTFANRAIYLYMPEIAADALAGLGPDQWTRAAWMYENSGQRERAREYYEKALAHDPRDDYARDALERLAAESN